MGRRLLLLLAPRTKAAAPKAVASSLPAQDCPKTGAPASWYHQLFLRLETGCDEVFLHQTPNTKHGSPVRLGAHHLIHPRTSRKASRGPGCGPVRVLHALTWTGRISGRHSPQVTSCHPPCWTGPPSRAAVRRWGSRPPIRPWPWHRNLSAATARRALDPFGEALGRHPPNRGVFRPWCVCGPGYPVARRTARDRTDCECSARPDTTAPGRQKPPVRNGSDSGLDRCCSGKPRLKLGDREKRDGHMISCVSTAPFCHRRRGGNRCAAPSSSCMLSLSLKSACLEWPLASLQSSDSNHREPNIR